MHKLLVSFGIAALLLPVLASAQENQPPASGYCPHLYSDLQRGDRDSNTGGQVTELQKFLTDYYDLNYEDYVTGYFGRLTQQNVIRFQTEQRLPAFGYAGPLTRAKIASECGGGGNVSLNFSASPLAGPAPLTVKFTSNVQIPGPYTADGGSPKIVFGDGQEQVLRCSGEIISYQSPVPGGGVGALLPGDCTAPAVSHTYTSSGNYIARLVYSGGYRLQGSVGEIVIGTVTITVIGSQAQSPTITSLQPSSGSVSFTTVTITGTGFTATGNDIHFGSVGGIKNVSSNGTSLTFTVPVGVSACDFTSNPSSCTGAHIINIGPYQVYVQNTNGTSNAMTFTVTGGMMSI